MWAANWLRRNFGHQIHVTHIYLATVGTLLLSFDTCIRWNSLFLTPHTNMGESMEKEKSLCHWNVCACVGGGGWVVGGGGDLCIDVIGRVCVTSNFGKLCEQVRIFHLGLNRAVTL